MSTSKKTPVADTGSGHGSVNNQNQASASNKASSTKRLPLPRCPGPKLEPFRGTASVDIEFIEFIGSGNDMDSKVWKVRVDGKIYALKIVSA